MANTSTKAKNKQTVSVAAIAAGAGKLIRLSECSEEIDARVEFFEGQLEACEGEADGLHTLLNGASVYGLDGRSGREIVTSLRGGLLAELREAKRIREVYKKDDPGKASVAQNDKDIEALERKIAAARETLKGVIRKKTAIEAIIKGIRKAQRKYGTEGSDVKCGRAPIKLPSPDEPKLKAYRQERESAAEELEDLRFGDNSSATAREIIKRDIEAGGREASSLFDLTAAVDAEPGKVTRIRIFNLTDAEGGERTPLWSVLCALIPKQVEEYCIGIADKHYEDNGEPLPPEQRATRIAELKQRIEDLDWKIEGQILALNATGNAVQRRANQSIWSILQIRPVGKLRETSRDLEREEL